MLASEPKVVFDLYEWLPPYGETSLSFRMEGLRLEVDIFYAFPEDGPTKLRKKTLVFDGVWSFVMTAFPGVQMTSISHEGLTVNGSLMEFTNSAAAQLWQKHLAWLKKPIRHFHLVFLAQNRKLEVFAEECQLVG